MGPVFSISVYLVVWWTVLFAILPLGNRTRPELGLETEDGGDRGAPVNPNIRRKLITTTWVAAIVFAVIWVSFTLWLRHAGASQMVPE